MQKQGREYCAFVGSISKEDESIIRVDSEPEGTGKRALCQPISGPLTFTTKYTGAARSVVEMSLSSANANAAGAC